MCIGSIYAAAFALDVVTKESSLLPPQIKLPSCEITNPDMQPPEMNISNVQLDIIECFIRCLAIKEMGHGAVLNPHGKLKSLFPDVLQKPKEKEVKKKRKKCRKDA